MPAMLPFCTRYAVLAMDLGDKWHEFNPENPLQIGIMRQSINDDCLKPQWYSMNNFFNIRRPISEDYIDGFANLRYEHQMEILKKMGYDVDGVSTSEQPPMKNCRLNNLELEKQIESQNKEFFEIYDKLKSFKEGSGDWQAILEANNQFVPECNEEILIHLSDVLYFGALEPCPVCKHGKLVFRNSVYCCTGFDSPWSSCTHTVREPQRIPVEIPEKYKEKLGTDFKVRTRVLRDVTEFNEDEFEMYTKQPLFGLDFCIIGETNMRREEIEHKIEAMGGKITTEVHENLAAVISNAEEVEKCAGLMDEAFLYQIQVVPDSFLNEVMDNDPIEAIVKNDLSKWANNPYERIPERKPVLRQTKIVESVQRFKNSMHGVYSKRCAANEKIVYNEVVLNFIDISLNKNTYFRLQLFRHLYESWSYEPPTYIVRESMGRFGTSIGSTNEKSYATLESAQEEFNKIYFEETGNQLNTSEFVKKPGHYHHVMTDNSESLTRAKLNSQNNLPATKLSKPLFDLMKLMYDDEEVFKSTLLEYCFDLDTKPLEKLTKKQIQNAMKVMRKISLALNTGERKQIIALSNQFYSYFPHNFDLQPPPIIGTCKMVQEKMDMLLLLMQKQLRYEFLVSESNQEENLFDLFYAQLAESVEITPMNESSEMHTQICKYVQNTQSRSSYDFTAVEQIFEVTRHEETTRYAPHESNFNRQLLVHGTPIENCLGILTNGLKTDFISDGRGIFFSDSVSKAATFCRPGISRLGLVLLCEVAAGMTDVRYKHDNSKLMDPCETILNLGQYQPDKLHIRPDGLKIPNGVLVRREENTDFEFNEFIVFDETRVKIRYLVKLKFK